MGSAMTPLETRPPAMPTDALLLQATLPDNCDDCLPAVMQHLRSAVPHLSVRLHAAYAPTQKLFYAYLHLAQRSPIDKVAATALASGLKAEWPQLQKVRVSRLEKVFETAGASAGTEPVFHYAVEMDPESGWMPELAQWYDTEHMPGLAKVPGCIRATRFLNHDHGPLSLACYDLVTEETLGSDPWLAVRGTEWSSRMRPRFTNTIRTMFGLMAAAKG